VADAVYKGIVNVLKEPDGDRFIASASIHPII
jgi:hypothetical protein